MHVLETHVGRRIGAGSGGPGGPRRPGRGAGRGVRRRRRHVPDGQGLDLPHRLDHQAHHRRGGHDAGRGRPDRAGRPGRAVAAGAGVTDGRPHAGRAGRRRGPGRQADHRARPAQLPRRVRLPVRLLAPGGRPAVQRAEAGAAAAAARRGAGRVDGDAVPHPAAAPAGRGLAVQHLLRHPGRAGRAGLGPAAARVPGRAAVRAARHGRHRIRGTGRQAATGSPATTGPMPAGGLELVDAPGRAVEQPAGVPVRRRRPGLDRRRLARLRPDAARRRRPSTAASCCRPPRCGR